MGCNTSKKKATINPNYIFGSVNGKSIERFHQNIKKSETDETEYLGLELTNKMKVMLMSKPKVANAAVAINVGVGYMMDPWELPGLAHLCEHVLCRGSKKYTDENEYFDFLKIHEGHANAAIADTDTTYSFQIDPIYLEYALDRFSQFFIEPLFTDSAIKHEIKALDLKNEGYAKDDYIRCHLVQQENFKKGHDYTKFETGNKHTLLDVPLTKGINVRNELVKFHQDYYSANLMSLAVIGRQPIQQLIDMVVPLFSAVPNRNVVIPKWVDHPLGDEQVKKEIHIVPISNCKRLILKWPIPDQTPNYKTNPCDYITYTMNSKGPGSLTFQLQESDLAIDFHASILGASSGFDFFEISMTLIKDGKEHVYDIIKKVYQFINLLRKEQPKESIFTEIQRVNKVDFEHKRKESSLDYVTTVAETLKLFPFEEFVKILYNSPEFNPQKIQEILSLLHPDNMQIIIISPRYSGLTYFVEQWYNVQYSVNDIPGDVLAELMDGSVNEKLHIKDKSVSFSTMV